MDPTFQFTSLIFLLVFHLSIVVGTVVYIGLETTTENLEPKFWAIGSAIAFFVLCFLFIGFIWFANKRCGFLSQLECEFYLYYFLVTTGTGRIILI